MNDQLNNSQNQVEEIDWDFPEIGSQEEEKKKRIKLFAPDIYFVQCVDYKITRSPRPNQYTGQHDINCTWQFKILKSLSGGPLKYSNGDNAQSDLFPLWTNVTNLATTKEGKPQDTRAVMTALMGKASNAVIGKPTEKDFLGKFARVTCEVGVKKDGSPKQIWSSWAPWNGKEAQAAQAQVQEAQPQAQEAQQESVNA